MQNYSQDSYSSEYAIDGKQGSKQAQHTAKMEQPSNEEARAALQAIQLRFPLIDLKKIVDLLHCKINIECDPKFTHLLENSMMEGHKMESSLLSRDLLSHEPSWKPEAIDILVSSYIANQPIQETSQILLQKYGNGSAFGSRGVQQQLRRVLQDSLWRLKQEQELPECAALGRRFKKLVNLDPEATEMILELPEAREVRVALCQFYTDEKKEGLNLRKLSSTILEVNQFVNRKENEAMQLILQRARASNSISREEYAFEGKRRKVLVLKKQAKPRKPQL